MIQASVAYRVGRVRKPRKITTVSKAITPPASVQEYHIKHTEAIPLLMAGIIKQAVVDASKRGAVGYEACFWLEAFGIPYLDGRGVDTKALRDFVRNPYKVRVKFPPYFGG